MSVIDISILIISVIGIFLEMWQKPVFWLTYIIAAILLGFQFWKQDLLGSSFLQICYIVMAILGWYKWLQPNPSQGKSQSLLLCHTTKRQWCNYIVTTIFISYFLYTIFSYYHASSPLIDGILTAISLVATYMAIYKQISSWFVFAATTLISIPLYLSHGFYFTAITYLTFGVLDLIGGIKWLKDYNTILSSTH